MGQKGKHASGKVSYYNGVYGRVACIAARAVDEF